MKKDKKFLSELEANLDGIKDKYKKEIISKYEGIISERKAKKEKIAKIIKSLGSPEEVAKTEIESLGKNAKKSVFSNIGNRLSNLRKNKKETKKEEKPKEEKTLEKPVEVKEEVIVEEPKEEIKEEVKETNSKKKKKKKKKNKQVTTTEEVKTEEVEVKEETPVEEEIKEEEKTEVKETKEKKSFLAIFKKKEKEEKETETKEKKSFFDKFKKKDKDTEDKKEKKAKKEKVKDTTKKTFKERLSSFKAFITKDISFKKKRKVKDTPQEVVEEIIEEIEEEISEVSNIVPEKKIFESRKTRVKRIILKTLGVLFTIVLLFIWLWVTVIFLASIFAYLDGVKFIGLIIGFFGIDLLVLWIVIMINRAIFRKAMSLRINLIVCIVALALVALGIVLCMREVNEIEKVEDVSIKYTMTTKLEKFELPSKPEQKFTLTFNSNYNTQYTINYDDTLKDVIKIETKYYECYYDYYFKKVSNGAYVSLKLDNRDRLAVYIDDLKEKKIFDNDELSRYTVKITVNSKDANRLVVQN